jgi:hypothetical protein
LVGLWRIKEEEERGLRIGLLELGKEGIGR